MQPFKLRVDWLLWSHEQGRVVVELHQLNRRYEKPLRYFDEPNEAVRWARRWLEDRGFRWYCDVDTHQRCGHKHVTLHACGLAAVPPGVE